MYLEAKLEGLDTWQPLEGQRLLPWRAQVDAQHDADLKAQSQSLLAEIRVCKDEERTAADEVDNNTTYFRRLQSMASCRLHCLPVFVALPFNELSASHSSRHA